MNDMILESLGALVYVLVYGLSRGKYKAIRLAESSDPGGDLI